MGSDTFRNIVPISDMGAAFADAREDAQHEHGHRGYTGSIAEKYNCQRLSRTPMSEAAAHAFADRLLATGDAAIGSSERHFITDKFADAGAIPLTASTKDMRKVTKAVTLTPRGGLSQSDLSKIVAAPYTAQNLPAVKDAITLREHEQWLTTDTFSPAVTYGAPTVTTGKGKRVTQYAIKENSRIIGWGSTQAEARAKAVAMITAPRGTFSRTPGPLTIEPVVTLDSGEALLTVAPKITKITFDVTAHLWTPGNRDATITGWMFVGTAAC